MPYRNLDVATDHGVCTIAIDRVPQLNALDGNTLIELLRVLGDIAGADSVHGVVLTGKGDKAFVAGADIRQMADLGAAEARAFAELGHRVAFALEELDRPVVAAVNGFALGGGCELALACDFIYASTRAKFGQPEVKLGLIPGFGGTQRLARRVGKAMAKEMILTGRNIDAQEALRIGLCNAVFEPAELLPAAVRTVREITAQGPAAVAQAKRAIQAGEDLPLSAACEIERQMFAALFAGAEAREGMKAFVDKRAPVFRAPAEAPAPAPKPEG